MSDFSRAIQIQLYFNKSQTILANNSIGIDRFVFNRALALKKSRYENHGENLSWIEISKMFTLMKKSEDYNFLNIASRSVIEQSLQKLDRAYANFFKLGSGFPKFKKKNKSEESFVLSDPSEIVGDSHIKLPKFGVVKIRGLRNFSGKIKNVTVKKRPDGKFFATFTVNDVEKKVRVKNKSESPNRSVGIDVNLENFLTDSNGNRIENPKFKKEYIRKIKYYQKQLAKLFRKNTTDDKNFKQSREYRRVKLKLAILFQKISNKKKDFLHKLSNDYVKKHDVIRVENLIIKNMVRNHKLAESISMVAWGEFFRQLEYKSAWNDVDFQRVNPRNTSKTCSNCGLINEELTLYDREWTCECGAKHVRDENSAKNILCGKVTTKKEKISLKTKNKTNKTGKGIVRKADGGTVTVVLPYEVGNFSLNLN